MKEIKTNEENYQKYSSISYKCGTCVCKYKELIEDLAQWNKENLTTKYAILYFLHVEDKNFSKIIRGKTRFHTGIKSHHRSSL